MHHQGIKTKFLLWDCLLQSQKIDLLTTSRIVYQKKQKQKMKQEGQNKLIQINLPIRSDGFSFTFQDVNERMNSQCSF